MSARVLALLSFWLLVLLQPIWHLWLAPAQAVPPLLLFAIMFVPLMLPALLLLFRRPSGLFWAGVMALLPFCHGVTEMWTDPSTRSLAAVEIVLSVALIFAIARDGLQRRRAQRANAAMSAASDSAATESAAPAPPGSRSSAAAPPE